MSLHRPLRLALAGGTLVLLSACGGGIASGDSGLFRRSGAMDGIITPQEFEQRQAAQRQQELAARGERKRGTIWDLFENKDDPNTKIEVNKYLWTASLDVLNFLPIQSVDPFSGVIVTGYGTPPGGGRAYRATIYIQDPALDARSLKVSLVASDGGQVSPDTARAVEDAILTRARELRIRDSKL